MATVTDPEKIISGLNDLMELDYDAIAAYRTAIDRLESAAYKVNLTEFMGDHERHVEELGRVIRDEGGRPAVEGDAKKVLTQGKVVLADLAGDQAILKAMKSNEEQTNSKYEEAVDAGYPEHIQAILKRGLSDERLHRAWLIETLENQ